MAVDTPTKPAPDARPELRSKRNGRRNPATAIGPAAGGWWADLPLKAKIFTGMAVPLVGSLIIGILGMVSLSAASGSTREIYNDGLIGTTLFAEMRDRFQQMQVFELGAPQAQSAEAMQAELDGFIRASEELADLAAEFRAVAGLTSHEEETVDDLLRTIGEFERIQDQVLTPLVFAGDIDAWNHEHLAQVTPVLREADTLITKVSEGVRDSASDAMIEVDATARSMWMVSILVIAVSMALSLIIGRLVANRITKASGRVLAVMNRVAKGDLTGSTGISSRDDMGQLGAALDEATTNLRQVMRGIVSEADAVARYSEDLSASSTQISAAAEETSSQAGAVATASEEVSSNVQTVSAGAEEMSLSIQEIASNTAEAAAVAGRAVEAAQSTSALMHNLNDSSGEIGRVTSLITSIAAQTNLLALNATIEAARAGESGKGFAVVANEVKELAQASANAANEISQLIEGIQADTSAAVAAIEGISSTIMQISDRQAAIASAVEEQTATTSEISRSVAEAAAGVGEIVGTISGVSSAAESTTQVLNRSTSAIEELTRMAADLRASVANFTY